MRGVFRKGEWIFWLASLIWVTLAAWSASFWYDVGAVRIDDSPVGHPIQVLYTGGARRDFRGAYSVILREAATGQVVDEDRSSVFQYRVGVDRPDPIFLTWWAPGLSETIPVGSYVIETCWTVHGAFWGLVPPKTSCATSNIFRITPRNR